MRALAIQLRKARLGCSSTATLKARATLTSQKPTTRLTTPVSPTQKTTLEAIGHRVTVITTATTIMATTTITIVTAITITTITTITTVAAVIAAIVTALIAIIIRIVIAVAATTAQTPIQVLGLALEQRKITLRQAVQILTLALDSFCAVV